MSRRSTPWVALLLIFFASLLDGSTPVHAQRYHVRTFHEQDGLASNHVSGILQDQEGRLLFSTGQGISTFNGLEWELLDSVDQSHPPGPGLITRDGNDDIWWIGRAFPFRLLRYRGGQWTQLEQSRSPDFNLDKVNFTSWTDPTGQTTLVYSDRGGRLHARNDSGWHDLIPAQTDRTIYSLGLLGSRLLVCTKTGLLETDLRNPEMPRPSSLALPPGPVYAMAQGRESGVVWLVGEKWFARILHGELDQVVPAPGLDNTRMQAPAVACVGPAGGVYFADLRRVFYFHPESGLEKLDSQNGLATGGANDILVDREGSVWFSSFRGVSQIVSRRLACWGTESGLQDEEVSAICHRRDGSVVLGHRTGITILDPEIRTIPFTGLSTLTSRIIDIQEDSRGRVWLAADCQGLGRLNPDDSVSWWKPEMEEVFSIYALLPRTDGSILVGTSHGLARFEDGKFEFLDLRFGPQHKGLSVIRRLVPLSDDRVLVATAWEGCHLLQDGQLTSFPGDDKIGTRSTYTALEYSDGRIWVGSERGLFMLGREGLERPDNPALNLERPIYSLATDREGRAWLGTDDGVRIWDGVQLERIAARDGLLGNETNRDALGCDNRGRMWVGTNSGLSIYDRDFDFPMAADLRLYLKSAGINEVALALDQPMSFSTNSGTLVFQFRAPTFLRPEDLEFEVQVIGSDSSDSSPRIHQPGVLTLFNLPPGQVQFQVQARAGDGRVSNWVTTPLITVVPPLLDRWYARGALLAAGLFLIWLVLAYFANRRYSRRLEQEVAGRTRELSLSEEVARRESQRLGSILESISDGVLAVDGQGHIVLVNRAAESILAPCPRPILDTPLENLLPPSALDNPRQRQRYTEMLQDFGGIRLNSQLIPVRVGDESIRWFEVSAVPLSETSPGTVFAFRDITDRRRNDENERRAQKLESLGLLAGGIAHDFNNLLTVMVGSLSLLNGDNAPNGTQKVHQDLVHRASQRARKLTHQLLTFAKGGQPRLERVDLGSLVADSVSFSLSGSNVTCDTDFPGVPVHAEVDPDQFAQVIGNLVINACQAMPDGGRMFVRVSPAEDDQTVQVHIQDFGPGIPPADQARVFDPYFSTKPTGSGLGLAIVHSIVKKHRGELTLDSTPGQGITILITLPTCEPASPLAPEVSAAGPFPAGRALRILFMDDEEDIRFILEGILQNLGHLATPATNGAEVLQEYEAAVREGQEFDLIILDLTIPGGMGGLETLQELRRRNPLVPVLVASGYSDDPVMADYQEFGFTGSLAKPFSLQQVQQALASVDIPIRNSRPAR